MTGTDDAALRASTVTPPSRHLRLVRPPDPDPPDAGPGSPRLGRHRDAPDADAAPVQGTLALLFTLPGGAPVEPAPRRTLRLARYQPGPEGDPLEERVPTSRADLPDPRRWTARLVQASVEAREGDRPLAQLLRWTTREVYDHLTRETVTTRKPAGVRRRTTRPVMRSLHLEEPADGIVEACAVVEIGARSRAVALRLEGLDGRWLCTELTVL